MLKDVVSSCYPELTTYRKGSYQKIATWLGTPCIVEGFGEYTYLKEGVDFEYVKKKRYNSISQHV